MSAPASRLAAHGETCRPLVAALVATSILACAPPGPPPNGNYSGDRPTSTAVVDQPVFDFGTVEPGTIVRHQYVIRNDGQHPLDLVKITPGCGCTYVKPVDKTIWPGHAGILEVALDTHGLSGPQSKAVRIRTNEGGRPEVELRFQGQVASDVKVTPDRVVLGRPGTPLSGSVEVEMLDPAASVTGVKSQYGQLELHQAPLGGSGRGVKIVVTPRRNGLTGLFNDRIVVTTTSKRQPKVTIPVMGSL
ncbi:DUF1573 domain-containing protein [bacterium]|nr:DUF1573 domain-containing protein [bacterium]